MITATTERRSRRTVRAAAWLLALVVAGSALVVGTVHTVTLCVVTGVLAVAAALAWWRGEAVNVRPAATLLLGVAVVLTGYTALQCVPMPIGWLAAVAPHSADIWSRALSPLHEAGPAWAPISLDPPGTRIELLKGVAYLLAFLTALRIARSREGVQFLCNTLVAAAVLVAVASLVNVSLHEDKLFGVYAPHDPVMPRHMAPLLNPNHLAAYLNVGFCVALAMGLDREASATTRTIHMVATVLLGGMVLWVASRGGVAAMVLGAALVFAVMRTRQARARTVPVVAGLMVAAGVVVGVLASSDGPFDAWAELASADTSKLTLFRQPARMLALYPWLGAGRGAFDGAFPEVRTILGAYGFAHPEDIVLQWTIEWGLPLAIAAFVAAGVALRPSIVLARPHVALGAWAAVLATATHDLADFSMEVPAVTIAPAAAAAVVVGGVRGGGGGRRWWHAWAERPRRVAVVLAVAGAGAVALTVPVMGHELVAERDAMFHRAVGPDDAAAPFHAAVRSAILRHPADAYFAYSGAVRAARTHDESVMPWIERALERSPVYPGAHMVLAQQLRARFPAQARLEYRTAVEQAEMHDVTGILAKEVSPIVRSFDDASEVLPQGSERLAMIEPLVEALPDRLPATCARLDDTLLAAPAPAPEPLHRRAREGLQDLQADDAAPWCMADRAACLAGALRAAKAFQDAAPGQCDGYVLEARMRLVEGQGTRAVDVVAAHVGAVTDAAACLVAFADLAIDAKDEARATMATDRLARLPCEGQSECLQNLLSVADIESRRGNKRRALVFYRRALEMAPEDEWVLSLVADAAVEVGLYGEAIQSYERLVARHPDNARYTRGLAYAKSAAFRGGAGVAP